MGSAKITAMLLAAKVRRQDKFIFFFLASDKIFMEY